MKKPIQAVASKIVWACPWYHIRQDSIKLPNGTIGVYNVVVKEPAVWIVPVTSAGEIVLIHTYRHTVGEWCWEIPAGSKKPEQSLEEAARTELREEIGGEGGILTHIGHFFTANGISNEQSHIFLATGIRLGQPAHEPAEVIEVHPTPAKEALRMARAGEIQDGGSALAILLCEGYLGVGKWGK